MSILVNKNLSEEQCNEIAEQIDNFMGTQEQFFTVQELYDYLLGCLSFQLNPDESKSIKKSIKAYLQKLSSKNQCFRAGLDRYSSFGNKQIKVGKVFSSGSKFFVKDSDSGESFYAGVYNIPYQLFDGDEVWYCFTGNDSKLTYDNGDVCKFLFVQLKKRTEKLIVCRVSRDRSGTMLCVPENSTKYPGLIIFVNNLDSSFSDAELVAVKLLEQSSDEGNYYCGECAEILGSADNVSAQVKAAIIKYELPSEWPEEVKSESSEFTDVVPESMKRDRVDLTELPLITIDGEDSRDFDDAVYCEPLNRKEKGWKLYVAIADVSHYVRQGTALDREAFKRGNSVYFPDTVIPMLPEILSNGLCSLNPNVDRLCMVCEMIIDHKGELEKYRFYPATMHSKARMTYTKIHGILEGEQELVAEYQDIYSHIINLYELYKALDKARKRRYAIEFESEEVKFIFDQNRYIEDIQPLVRNESHKMIEECMIVANVAAAKFIEDHEQKTVFRIHPNPIDEKVGIFRNFIARYGLSLAGGDEPTTKDYAEFLEQIQDRPDRTTMNMVMLRSLAKAVYSPNNCGHFGLALKQYAHFTSPIRRYPDLMLHREIKYLLEEDRQINLHNIGEQHYEYNELANKGEHCSDTERRADEATFEVAAWLKCQFMEDKIGQSFEAIIVNVVNFGLFVMIEKWHIDGLVYVGNMGGEFFEYDAQQQTLIGTFSHRVFKIGDKLDVIVKDIDLSNKRINFIFDNKKNRQSGAKKS